MATMNTLIAHQREWFPVNVDALEWTTSRISRYYRVRGLRGHSQVHVKCPHTGYTGWAVQKTEEEARTKALARLLYARDYGLEGYREP